MALSRTCLHKIPPSKRLFKASQGLAGSRLMCSSYSTKEQSSTHLPLVMVANRHRKFH